MGKSYSGDLRDRVVGFVTSGHSRREAARQFGVSESFAVKLLQRVARTGSSAPGRLGRPPGKGKLAAQLPFLIERVEAEPDFTMPELAAVLMSERGVEVHPASLSKLLIKAGYTYKKTASGERAKSSGRSREAPRMDRQASAENAAGATSPCLH